MLPCKSNLRSLPGLHFKPVHIVNYGRIIHSPRSRSRTRESSRIVTRCSSEQRLDSETYRRATKDDLSFIQKSLLAEWMNPLGLDYERFLVAEDADGGLLGFAQTEKKAANDGSEYIEFRSLFVKKDARGAGIGSSLLSKLITKSGDCDIFVVTIDSVSSFYEKQGFVEVLPSACPLALQLERQVGAIVARLAVNDKCIIMKVPGQVH